MFYKGTPERNTSFPNGEVNLKPGMKVEYKNYLLGYKTLTLQEIKIETHKSPAECDICMSGMIIRLKKT